MLGARYTLLPGRASGWEDPSLSPIDHKHRPWEESMEPNSCCLVRGIHEGGLEHVWL